MNFGGFYRLGMRIVVVSLLGIGLLSALATPAGPATAQSDPQAVAERFTIELNAQINGVAWSPDETQLAIWTEDGQVIVYDPASGQQQLTLTHDFPVTGLRWNVDGSQLAAWSPGSLFGGTIWDVDPASETYGQALFTISADDDSRFVPTGEIRWSPDETLFAVNTRFGIAQIYDAQTGELLLTLQHTNIVWGTAWDAAGERLLTWSSDGTARIWPVTQLLADGIHETDEAQTTLRPPVRGIVWQAHWSPDETHVLVLNYGTSPSPDGSVYIYHVESGQLVQILPQANFAAGMHYSRDEAFLLTSSIDGLARVWHLESGQLMLGLLHERSAVGITPSFDERYLLTTGGGLHIWDSPSGGLLAQLPAGKAHSWRPRSHDVLVVPENEPAVVWQVADEVAPVAELPLSPQVSEDDRLVVAWRSDGLVLALSFGNTLSVWDIALPTLPVPEDAASPFPAPLPPPPTGFQELALDTAPTDIAILDPRVQPGESVQMVPVAYTCCSGYFDPEQSGYDFENPTWTVEAIDGVSIDAQGVLTVTDDVPAGTLIKVTATQGDLETFTYVRVYSPEANPFIGYWHEVAQLDCESGAEIPVEEQGISEIYFGADGEFSVTWRPFEAYKDYWGPYFFDPERGLLHMQVFGSNFLPEQHGPHGHFELTDNGDLILRDMWLGQWVDDPDVAHCGHRLARRG